MSRKHRRKKQRREKGDIHAKARFLEKGFKAAHSLSDQANFESYFIIIALALVSSNDGKYLEKAKTIVGRTINKYLPNKQDGVWIDTKTGELGPLLKAWMTGWEAGLNRLLLGMCPSLNDCENIADDA